MKLGKEAKRLNRRAVLIEWIDSAGAEGWTVDGSAPSAPVLIVTLGWLVREDRLSITVASSATKAKACDAQSHAPMAIPRCAISRWRYL